MRERERKRERETEKKKENVRVRERRRDRQLVTIYLTLAHFSREFPISRFSREVPFLTRNENETRSRSWLCVFICII